MTENQLASTTESAPALLSSGGFDMAQRMASALAKSTLIPEQFRNNLPNCLIALEMANRMGASPMMVMQNLYIVHGKPAWSSQFVIAAVNSTGKFSPLRFSVTGAGDDKQCVAWAIEHRTKERLESPPVSIGMAKKEGWYGKNGSKWQTLPDLMLRYRSATFFGRLYAPEVLMGMREETEVIDVDATVVSSPCPAIEKPVFGVANGNGKTEPPTHTPESQATTDQNPKPEPKRKVREKTAPPQEQTLKDAVLDKVKASGYTADQVLAVAVDNLWIEPNQNFNNLPQDKLQEFNNNWDAVIGLLEARFSGGE